MYLTEMYNCMEGTKARERKVGCCTLNKSYFLNANSQLSKKKGKNITKETNIKKQSKATELKEQYFILWYVLTIKFS